MNHEIKRMEKKSKRVLAMGTGVHSYPQTCGAMTIGDPVDANESDDNHTIDLLSSREKQARLHPHYTPANVPRGPDHVADPLISKNRLVAIPSPSPECLAPQSPSQVTSSQLSIQTSPESSIPTSSSSIPTSPQLSIPTSSSSIPTSSSSSSTPTRSWRLLVSFIIQSVLSNLYSALRLSAKRLLSASDNGSSDIDSPEMVYVASRSPSPRLPSPPSPHDVQHNEVDSNASNNSNGLYKDHNADNAPSNMFQSLYKDHNADNASSNMFESLYQVDNTVSDQQELFYNPQYGTSLAISENSRYTRQLPKATTSSPLLITASDTASAPQVPHTDSGISFNLDFLSSPQSPSKPKPASDAIDRSVTDYDRAISNFYFPTSPIPRYKFSIIDTIVDVTSTLTVSDFFKIERNNLMAQVTKERQLQQPSVSPLNSTDLSTVVKFWRSENSSHKVVSSFAIDITVRDLKTLRGTAWLNDNIIDFYFNLITAKSPNVFGWTTHFFTTLKSRGYTGVARWSRRKKVNVNTKELVMIPINIMGAHWALAVVDNKLKTITYYDSLTSSGNLDALLLIKDYMIQEGVKNNTDLDYNSFELIPNFKTPQQQNGSDCGVFTCTCANFLAQGQALTYSQKDMSIIRSRMAHEIINQGLLDVGKARKNG